MITEFRKASSVEDAVALFQDGYVFLAGGTQVNSTPYRNRARSRGHRIEKVVSLAALDLSGISGDGNEWCNRCHDHPAGDCRQRFCAGGS